MSVSINQISNHKIAVIGMGYVGLPLATAFGKYRDVIGFDINQARLDDLKKGLDQTREVSASELQEAVYLSFSNNLDEIADCDIYIVTVPTPIKSDKTPDLGPLLSASQMIGKVLGKGDIVIYESTVYPGCTEEDCAPILAAESGLSYNKDFFCGYSPERINPGDKSRRITDIVKVTSGSTPQVADFVNAIYAEIISAGTYQAESIKVAEAAKVIENTQRDVNIALMNELTKIFSLMDIDTQAVLSAAGTKWNFLPFTPGLVGGHCIGVDPYYLTYKAQKVGYDPQMILAGRDINDGMGAYVANNFIVALSKQGTAINKANILIAGLTFKENCPDIRNTRVVDIYQALEESGAMVDVFDPWVSENDARIEYGIKMTTKLEPDRYDGVIIAVGHSVFAEKFEDIRQSLLPSALIYDLKYILPKNQSDLRL